MHDALKFYGERISDILSPKSTNDVNLVSKGLVLYRQGTVVKLSIESDLIQGVVQDVTKVNVTLDLSFPSNSSCSCPAIDLCRHQLAVFFAAYSKEASVTEWVDHWKNKEDPMFRLKESLKNGPVYKEKSKPSKPEHTYSAWKEFFIHTAREELAIPPYFMAGINRSASNFQRAIQRSEPSNQQWVPLYRSIAYYMGLVHLFDLQSSTKDHFQEELLESMIHELFLAFKDEVHRFESSIRPFDSEEFIHSWIDETKNLPTGEMGSGYYRWDIYRTIWTNIITTKEERGAEIDRLSNQLPALADSLQIELVFWMMIHIYMVDGKDEQALECLNKLGPISCFFLTFVLEELHNAKEHARMVPFVEFFSKNIKAYLHDYQTQEYKRTRFLYNALQIIRPFCSAAKRFDLLERILRETIPYSLIPYSHYLYEKKEYKKWVELQVAERVDVLYEWSNQTKEIQKEQPEVLLPILHLQVVNLIAAKNRSSYREAVRYLKKLRTIYKKLKRVNVWESYIEYISDDNKRLRAFQEELKKGKLIDAAD